MKLLSFLKSKPTAQSTSKSQKRKLSLLLHYSSVANPKGYFGMSKEHESDSEEEHAKFRKIYEDELNEGLAKLNAAGENEFIKILDAVFQKKYFVSFTLSDS